MGVVMTEPDDGSISPAIPFSRVVFPEPFGPMIAAMWPSGIQNEDGATAVLEPYRNAAASPTTAGSVTGTKHTALRFRADVR